MDKERRGYGSRGGKGGEIVEKRGMPTEKGLFNVDNGVGVVVHALGYPRRHRAGEEALLE